MWWKVLCFLFFLVYIKRYFTYWFPQFILLSSFNETWSLKGTQQLSFQYVCYEISENSYEFIRRLLLLPNVQSYLTCIWLVLPKLSQALSILSQLSNWLFIESVDLSYWENDSEVDPLELIKISINSFTKKVGIIEELNVKLETNKH